MEITVIKKYVTFVTLIIISSLNSFSQEFHASALWDANGKVKEIKYTSTKDVLLRSKKMKFNKDGKLKNSFLVYNAEGWPIGMGFDAGVMSINAEFTFNGDNLRTITMTITNKDKIRRYEVNYDYSINRMDSKAVDVTYGNGDEAGKIYSYQFSDYKYDDNGNWVSRRVNVTETAKGESEPTVDCYIEVRQIKYWE